MYVSLKKKLVMSVAFKVTTVEIFILLSFCCRCCYYFYIALSPYNKNRILLLYFIVKKLTHIHNTNYIYNTSKKLRKERKKIISTGKSHALFVRNCINKGQKIYFTKNDIHMFC